MGWECLLQGLLPVLVRVLLLTLCTTPMYVSSMFYGISAHRNINLSSLLCVRCGLQAGSTYSNS